MTRLEEQLTKNKYQFKKDEIAYRITKDEYEILIVAENENCGYIASSKKIKKTKEAIEILNSFNNNQVKYAHHLMDNGVYVCRAAVLEMNEIDKVIQELINTSNNVVNVIECVR